MWSGLYCSNRYPGLSVHEPHSTGNCKYFSGRQVLTRIPASPLVLPCPRQVRYLHSASRCHISDHTQPWPQLRDPLFSFKSPYTISEEPKLITDFKTQRFQVLSICYSVFKGHKGQTSPPFEADVFESCSQDLGKDWTACWFRASKESLQVGV